MNDITLSMIEEMQHCIGFDKNKITGTKHRIMYAYRNHFCDIFTSKTWCKLVELGLAKQSIMVDDETGITYFHLTDEGFKFLSKLCRFEKIIKID